MVDAIHVLQRSMRRTLVAACGRRTSAARLQIGASRPAAQAWMMAMVFTSLLTLGGCDRKPSRAPSSPEPPRPKMSPDGYRQSLLGNAILSNALLSYKVQCNEQRASIRICRIPAQVHTNREALGT